MALRAIGPLLPTLSARGTSVYRLLLSCGCFLKIEPA